jgi:hypothetical protein
MIVYVWMERVNMICITLKGFRNLLFFFLNNNNKIKGLRIPFFFFLEVKGLRILTNKLPISVLQTQLMALYHFRMQGHTHTHTCLKLIDYGKWRI